MVSLSVFKIKSDISKLTNKLSLMSETPNQRDLGASGIGNKLTQGITTLEFEKDIGGYKQYKIHQESNTQIEPIKVYKWELIEEFIGEEEIIDRLKASVDNSITLRKGYQVISDFVILLNVSENILYVFSKKDDGILLQKRLIKNNILNLEPFELDLTKIKLVPEIVDEWGAWLLVAGL